MFGFGKVNRRRRSKRLQYVFGSQWVSFEEAKTLPMDGGQSALLLNVTVQSPELVEGSEPTGESERLLLNLSR